MKTVKRAVFTTVLFTAGVIACTSIFMRTDDATKQAIVDAYIHNTQSFYTNRNPVMTASIKESTATSSDTGPNNIPGVSGGGPQLTGDTGLDVAKIVALTMCKNGDVTQADYKDDTNYPGFTTADYNGKSYRVPHRDCSGFVCGWLVLTGFVDNDRLSTNSAGFLGLSGTPAFGTKVYDKATDANKTFADINIQVGDVIVCEGHVAVCVQVDASQAYFGDCGANSHIAATATKGWYQSFNLSDLVYKWRSSKQHVRVYRRLN